MRLCYALSQNKIKQCESPLCSQRVVLWDSNIIFDRTQLSAVGESLLCDYSMVVDYILEINLTKRKTI